MAFLTRDETGVAVPTVRRLVPLALLLAALVVSACANTVGQSSVSQEEIERTNQHIFDILQ